MDSSSTIFCKKSILTCLFAGLFCTANCFAQYKLEQPVTISKEDGLPSNDTRSIKKDKDGFVWMGTTEGLCRFDGQQIKVYRQENDLRTAPFDNIISAVLPLDNEVWIGTGQGISVLNTNDDTFRHYQLTDTGKSDSLSRQFHQAIGVLYLDKQGDIWVGTRDRGVWMYEKEKDNFRKFIWPDSTYKRLVPALGSIHTILSIEGSKFNDSIVWVGTTAGLQKINKYKETVNWYTYPQTNKSYQVSLNAFRRLYHHDNDLLYVGSWEAGINVFDPATGSFTPLPLKESNGNNILKSPISSIQRKSSEEIWITCSDGLVIYNTTQQAITWYKFNQILKYEFYGVDYIDNENRIWHSNINGFQYFDPVVQQFSTWSFEHLYSKNWAFSFYILSDPAGNLITVCPRVADGLYHFDKSSKEWTRSDFNGLKAMGYERLLVRGFSELSPGQYIISADEGLFLYSLHSKTIRIMPNHPPIVFKRWGDLIKDSFGNLWISADADGLMKWNIKENKYQLYKKELLSGTKDEGIGRSNSLFEDSRHNIWFSRSDGFSVYIAAKGAFENFTYTRNPVNSFPIVNRFAEDKNGKVWLCSGDGWYGYGDSREPEKGVLQKFYLKDRGISGGHMPFIAADKEGNIWGYTAKQLVKINADDLSVSSFSFDYGVKAVDFFHLSFLPSGEMVFGGRNSITLANTSEFKRNAELPVPYIVQFKLMNHTKDLSFYSGGKELQLNHRQNFISISFSARAFTMPDAVRFRYRLKEFDDWVETSTGRLANYTNVPSGSYVFQLQAANNEGIWNEAILELPIHISTPWWQTWLFRITAVLLIAGLIYRLYRYRVSQIKKKEKLKTQYEKKLANVEMTALLAQMNPHFLFNSLNSIDSYIIKNESGKASEYLNNFARLMRLILQNSRSNYISLKDELEALDLYLQMERLRFKDKFEYEIRVDDGLDTSSVVIPPMLIQPYVENAVWHGLMHKQDGINGKVEIIINQQDNNLICVVQDNGIGREKAQELKDQKPGNRKRSMGLQITNDRIEMINKLYDSNTSVRIIDLKDGQGKATGTCVKLIIPF